jgi:serine phosphatase RsbU (regulator of sigma subunit)
MILEGILNLGASPGDEIQHTRLIRQMNGLNAFFLLFASSGGLLLRLFIPGSVILQVIQTVAAVAYLSNLVLNANKIFNLTRYLTLIVFELQLFSIILFTNTWASPVIFLTLLFPLLAALVETSIIFHLGVALAQIGFFFVLRFFIQGTDDAIKRIAGIDANASGVIQALAIFYVPMMATVIIQIIFNENLRAREKQKDMLNQISIANKQLEIYAERLKDESQRLQAELNIARRIQTMVLPLQSEVDLIEELEISFIMRPADEVGGDYYDIIKISDFVTIGIGDVTGHGLSSGIIMLMAQTAIRTITEMKITNPKEMIAILNRVLFSNIKRIRENRNMTLLLITYKDREYTVSGQHESAIICRKDGRIENVDTLALGFYVGLLPDIEPNLATFRFSLEPEDLLLLYSDGITEGMNEKGEQFGLEQLQDAICKYRALPTQRIKYKIIGDLYNFMGSTTILDDISLVVIRQKEKKEEYNA